MVPLILDTNQIQTLLVYNRQSKAPDGPRGVCHGAWAVRR